MRVFKKMSNEAKKKKKLANDKAQEIICKL